MSLAFSLTARDPALLANCQLLAANYFFATHSRQPCALAFSWFSQMPTTKSQQRAFHTRASAGHYSIGLKIFFEDFLKYPSEIQVSE
jgi:hypothetical protein